MFHYYQYCTLENTDLRYYYTYLMNEQKATHTSGQYVDQNEGGKQKQNIIIV